MRTEYLLFAVHGGTFSGRAAGVVLPDHALPLACYPSIHAGDAPSEVGVHSLWDATCDVEDFFRELCIDHAPGRGLWVAEIQNHSDDATLFRDDWDHLDVVCGFRRPTIEELTRLANGECPWPGGKVF